MRLLPSAAAVLLLTATVFATATAAARSTTPSGSGASSAKKNVSMGIFDVATSPTKPASQQGASLNGRTSTASPFGTVDKRRVNDRRWKASCKIADCVQNRAIPPNTNLSLSGKINSIVSDGRYTIVRMFDSVEVKLENGMKADVPVTYTVVVDAEAAATLSLKEDTKKSFTVDSNYAYMVWDDDGCTVRAVHNTLTDQDDTPSTATKR